MTPLPTILEIQRAVARTHRVRVASLRAPFKTIRNARRIAWARQVSICLATRLTENSLSCIGRRHGGRTSWTVAYACRAVERRCRRDRRQRDRMRRLTLELLRK